MPSLRRRHPDPQSAGHAPLRSSLADAAMAVEDRVVWGATDLLRGIVDAVRWPFERIAWAVENWLVWPIQEETALWSRATRAAVLATVIALAGGAVAAGIVLSSPSGNEVKDVATLEGPAKAAVSTGSPSTQSGPVLHGSAPIFAPKASGAAPGAAAKSGEPEVLSSEPGGGAAGTKSEAAGSSGAAGASAGTGPEVAGPAAIKVAHKFAEAFVLYEVGNKSAKVKKAISATTSPELTQALLRRPPRLPSNVKVPKARVLNIVPGPSNGATYTLSVSLLRVGVTSELRIDMKRSKDGTWQVTDALG
jgi:hypothetical protein